MSGEMVQVDAKILKDLRLYLVQTFGKSTGHIGRSVGKAIELWLEKQEEKASGEAGADSRPSPIRPATKG